MFVLAGCIVDFDYYTNIVEKQAKELKLKYFGRDNIIFRSYDIRKQKSDFSILVNRKKREAFCADLDTLVSSLKFTIIAAAINKTRLKAQYHTPNNPYYICFQFILERVVMYLGRSSEKLIFRIESRETHNDQKLAKVYEDFRYNDHKIFKKEEIQSKLVDLLFNQKIQNIIGMQLADLVAYPIGRWVLDKTKENRAFTYIEKKFHTNPKGGGYLNYGLKIFP